MVRNFCHVLSIAVTVVFVAAGARALEVTVQAPDSVATDLRAGSLTAALVDGGDAQAGPPAIDILSAAQADYSRLIGILYEQGYFAPTISILLDGREAAGISPVAAPAAISTVLIAVDPGPVFSFGTVTITPAAPDAEPTGGLATGEVARISTLRAGAAAQIEGWRQAGYARAAIADQQITARHPERTLSAVVTLDPGPRLRFGRLIVEGETKVREKRLGEIMGWPEGAVFDPDNIDRVENRLRRTGTFAAATLTEAQEANPDGTLDVTATISDRLPRRYSFGAEYSSLDGLSLSALWLHRNLFGGAERLRVDGEIRGIGGQNDGVDYRLGALLTRPATLRTDLEAYLLADIEQKDDPNLFSRTARLELGGTYYARKDREYSYGIGLRRALTRDDLGARDYTILTIPLSATFDRRDNPLDATSGYYARAGLTPFLNINGTQGGLISTLDLRFYRQLEERVTLAFRGLAGSVAGPGVTMAPADYLFFSGGSGTVRGQEYQSLGVALSPTVTIGGRSFLGLSGEVRVRTGDNLSVVAFYDAGYIGPEAIFDGAGEWQTGYGLGVRYDTAIGPVRVDLALPGSGPGGNSGLEIYIGIGQAF